MPRLNYTKPPIVEAVIELQFETPWSQEAHGKLQDALMTSYPGKTRHIERDDSFGDPIHVVLLQTETCTEAVGLGVQIPLVAIHSLAPYAGWSRFVERTDAVLRLYDKFVRPRSLLRVSVRYIDRIVLPREAVLADYFTCLPPIPKGMARHMDGFSIVLQTREGGTSTQLAMSSDDPVDGKIVILYDLNIETQPSRPTGITAWKTLASEAHELQREIFENSITERTRRLFI